MATDFRNIVQIFDHFENYTNQVIQNCAEFTEKAQLVGTAIGAGAGALADAFSSDRDRKNSGVFTALGALAGNAIGEIVGNINESNQLKQLKANIYDDTVKDRDTYFEMLADTADMQQQSLDKVDDFIEPLYKKINDIAFNDTDETIIDMLRVHIIQSYQYHFVSLKAARICDFYNSFEEKLDEDVANFGVWAQEATFVDKEGAYFSIFNHIFDKLSENQSKEVQNKIQYAFSCVAAKSPIYTINFEDAYTQPFLSVRAEAAHMFSAILNKKKHIPKSMPDFYYRSAGFKELFNAASDSYYYGNRITSVGKIRTVLVGLLPALITVIFAWRSGNIFPNPYTLPAVYFGSFMFCAMLLLAAKHYQKKTAERYSDYYYIKHISDNCLDFEFRETSYDMETEIPQLDSNNLECIADDNQDDSIDELLELQKALEDSENK